MSGPLSTRCPVVLRHRLAGVHPAPLELGPAPLLSRSSEPSARTAALVDPDGESLAKCLAAIDSRSPPRIAAE